MIGPKVISTLTCASCDYLDDVICTKLNRMLNAMTLDTPANCPYVERDKAPFDECYSCTFYKPDDTICTCGITYGSFPINCPLNKKESP